MNASVLRIANKAHYHIHSLSNSLGVQHHSNAFYSRFPAKEIRISVPVPVRRLSTNNNNNNGGRRMPSITNSGFVGWYLGMIKTRPILTKSITSALIYTAADLTSQTIPQSSSSSSEAGYDVIRTCRMAGYGLIVLGPTLHVWFNFVSRMLPKTDLTSTFKKIFIGQAIFGPIMTAVFFSVNAALQGESGEEIMARLKRDMVPTMINNVLYWPICDFITFRFVPVHLQPLVSNAFSYVWTIYITYMANLSKAASVAAANS